MKLLWLRLQLIDLVLQTKLVDCAVQVVVKTANKSVNAHQEFANFRYDKQTQVTDDNNHLSLEEEAKFERDGRELGWFFMPDSLLDYGKPNWYLTIFARKIILVKLHARNYARSNSQTFLKLTIPKVLSFFTHAHLILIKYLCIIFVKRGLKLRRK